MIEAVLVTYNRKETLFRNLAELRQHPLIGAITVVDNASSDGTLQDGRAHFPDVKWIPSPVNGGCRSWNLGMAEVKHSWALILDDDCFVGAQSLDRVFAYVAGDPSVGLAAFNIINRHSGASEWGGMERVPKGVVAWPNAIGACMLTRVEAFRSVGGYKDFFLCFNDLELTLSLWRAGYRVVFDPSWVAMHLGLRSSVSKRRIAHEIRNLLWTVWGHLTLPLALAITLKFTAGALYDTRGQGMLPLALGAIREGICKGMALRRTHRGRLPPQVLRGVAWNFLFSGRTGAARLSPRLRVLDRSAGSRNTAQGSPGVALDAAPSPSKVPPATEGVAIERGSPGTSSWG